jgi:hypothetical protein
MPSAPSPWKQRRQKKTLAINAAHLHMISKMEGLTAQEK